MPTRPEPDATASDQTTGDGASDHTASGDGVAPAAGGGDAITADEQALLAASTALSRALLVDLGEVDLLQLLVDHAVRTSAATSAAVTTTGRDGRPEVAAASGRSRRTLGALQTAAGDGPSLDCIRTGSAVSFTDLAGEDRWPAWTPAALRDGIRSGRVQPLTAAGTTLGALALFNDQPGALGERSRQVGTALADVAAVAIATARRTERAAELAEQLQHALDSRVAVEQAKGVIATTLDVAMDEAFEVLRRYSRSHNRRLREVAELVASGRMDPRSMLPRG